MFFHDILLLLSQILWNTFVISNADEDVADNRHPFLPVVLPSSSVSKPFQYDSRNFHYAFVTPSMSNFLDSPAEFPHNSFNYRRSPGENQSPLQPAANITEHSDFCPSQTGCRRIIPSFLKIFDQLIDDRFRFLHSFFDIIFLFLWNPPAVIQSPARRLPPLNRLRIHLASTILIHFTIQININKDIASLLFRRVFSKSLGQFRFAIADQNTASGNFIFCSLHCLLMASQLVPAQVPSGNISPRVLMPITTFKSPLRASP